MSILNKPLKIAIVDDDLTTLKAIEIMLRSLSNIKIYTFSSASKAFEQISMEKDFAIVITDINMPEIPGEILVEKIANEKIGADIIVVTGSNSMVKTLPCIMQGARELIGKPIHKDQLLTAVQNSINRVDRIRDFYHTLQN